MVRKIGAFAEWAAVIVAAALQFFLAIGPRLFDYRTMVMLTGSMRPGIPPGSVVVGTTIYVFGGWNGTSFFNDPHALVQSIDTKTGRTVLLGRTPSYLAGQVPVLLRDGQVLLFGGFSTGLNGPDEHPEVFSFIPPSP